MFYTGDGLSARVARYVIDILDEPWLIENFNGALAYLGVPSNWRLEGSVNVDDAAERSNDALVTFRRYEMLIGSIQLYATASEPEDTLVCDGASYLRVDYPALYAALSSVYITDADNFTVPDLYQGTDLKYCIVAR